MQQRREQAHHVLPECASRFEKRCNKGAGLQPGAISCAGEWIHLVFRRQRCRQDQICCLETDKESPHDNDNDNDPRDGDVETANLESDDFDLSQRLVILIRLQSDEIDRDLQRNINIDKLQKYQRLIRP